MRSISDHGHSEYFISTIIPNNNVDNIDSLISLLDRKTLLIKLIDFKLVIANLIRTFENSRVNQTPSWYYQNKAKTKYCASSEREHLKCTRCPCKANKTYWRITIIVLGNQSRTDDLWSHFGDRPEINTQTSMYRNIIQRSRTLLLAIS